MEKRIFNTERISEMVKDRLLGDGGLIPEHRINKIVKDYLKERNDYLEDDTPISDTYEFTSRTQKAFDDMSDGIIEMIGDLEVIKAKEGDVLVETDVYSDEYLSNIISTLETVSEDLKILKSLREISDEEFSDDEFSDEEFSDDDYDDDLDFGLDF